MPGVPLHLLDRELARHVIVSSDGKSAQTRVRLSRCYGKLSLLQCSPLTGRTHQIRVHMTHIGHPLAGDPVYGRKPKRGNLEEQVYEAVRTFPRQALRGKTEFGLPESKCFSGFDCHMKALEVPGVNYAILAALAIVALAIFYGGFEKVVDTGPS